MKILQLNPAFYPAFAYGGTVNVEHLLRMGEKHSSSYQNIVEATT